MEGLRVGTYDYISSDFPNLPTNVGDMIDLDVSLMDGHEVKPSSSMDGFLDSFPNSCRSQYSYVKCGRTNPSGPTTDGHVELIYCPYGMESIQQQPQRCYSKGMNAPSSGYYQEQSNVCSCQMYHGYSQPSPYPMYTLYQKMNNDIVPNQGYMRNMHPYEEVFAPNVQNNIPYSLARESSMDIDPIICPISPSIDTIPVSPLSDMPSCSKKMDTPTLEDMARITSEKKKKMKAPTRRSNRTRSRQSRKNTLVNDSKPDAKASNIKKSIKKRIKRCWTKMTKEIFHQMVEYEKKHENIKQCELERMFNVNRSTYWRWKKQYHL